MKQINFFSFFIVICILFSIIGCSNFFGDNLTTDLRFKINLKGLDLNSRNITQTKEVPKLSVELISQDNSVSLKQEQDIIDNNVGLFTFNDIKVGTVINIVASIYLGEKEIYHGETDWQTVKPNDNQFSLTLEKIFYEPVKVTLTFDSNGGTDVSSISGVEGEKITSPAAPTKEGYAFVGWEPELPDVFPEEDTTFEAQWVNPITDWSSLVTAMEVDGGDIYISGNMTATSTLEVSYSRKILATQDVTITRDSSFTGAFFNNTSTLTLGDGTNTITLDGGKNNNINAQAPLIQSGGEGASLTLNNCKLQNNKNMSNTKGGAISISGGTFTMNGGVIGTEIKEEDESKQSWEDAADAEKFSNYAAAGGGGIYVADGTVEIKNAKVSYNSVPDDDAGNNPGTTSLKSGGGIFMEKGNLTLENTEVSYNRGYLGGGVRCYKDGTENVGTLTLKNATIKGNAGKHYAWSNFGGALAIRNFDVICDKSAEASIIEENYSADGGAVFLEGTTSTLENITIQNNSFNENGYRNGSEMLLYSPATILIGSSDVTIKSSNENEDRGIYLPVATDINLNLFGDVKLDTPIYLASGEKITIGKLTEEKVATITLAEDYTVGTQVLVAKDGVKLADQVAKFTLENEEFYIDTNGKLAKKETNQGTVTGITYAGTDEYNRQSFYIRTAEGLATFRDIVNGTLTSSITIPAEDATISNYEITSLEPNGNISATLMHDIDLQNQGWTPIGTEEYPFSGDFGGFREDEYDFTVKTISNLKITNATTPNQGLFGVIQVDPSNEPSNISNLAINGSITSTESNVGAFAGKASNVYFEYCKNDVTITTSNTNVGGIAGTATDTIFSSCVNLANITSTYNSNESDVFVGGIAGHIEANIKGEYCYNDGDISASKTVGGIFGYVLGPENNSSSFGLEYCINSGKISGNVNLGGIIGYSEKYVTIDYSANYGTIFSINGNTFGCIVGDCIDFTSEIQTFISECLVVGEVETTGEFYIASQNASTTYTIYDNTKLTPIGGGKGFETTALTVPENTVITDENFFSGDWSYKEGRYPIPNIEEYLEFIPGLWEGIVEAATPTATSGGTT